MKRPAVWFAFALLVSACGDSTPTVDGPNEPEPAPAPDGSDPQPTAPTAGPDPTEPEPLVQPEPDPVSEPEPVAPANDPCMVLTCNEGQRCEVTDGAAKCVALTCEELACTGTQECLPNDVGGNECVEVGCDEDVDCDPEQYCNTTAGLCEADVCVAQSLSCDGAALLECTSSGSGEAELYTCESPAYFSSECQPGGAETTGCTCSDDWDCPAFTVCEVGLCVGTGKAPSCTLPPVPFADTPPTIEIHWGGDSVDAPLAHDGSGEQNPAPWPEHSHVVTTPLVANLDDDNGDGLINELDFPEIIFFAYEDGTSVAPGILRAIHGGGPDKGKDMFAVCGTTVWREGDPAPASCAEPMVYGRDTAAVGDLDGDGSPEIVFPTGDRRIQIVSATGETLFLSEPDLVEDDTQFGGAAPAIANMDFDGLPEIAIGRQVFTLAVGDAGAPAGDAGVVVPAAGSGLYIEHIFEGELTRGVAIMGPQSCIADINGREGQELLAGTTLYAMPARTQCASPPCRGTLEVVWDGVALNPDLPTQVGGGFGMGMGMGMGGTGGMGPVGNPIDEGFCAIADVWGADVAAAPGPANPPDGAPEAVLIAGGWLEIFDGETGKLIFAKDLEGGLDGGAPNIDDFDGDGFMEIGSSLEDFYIMIDLQEPSENCAEWPTPLPRDLSGGEANPNAGVRAPGEACTEETAATDCAADAVCNARLGRCVCLHNGWKRETDDDSSRVTSSSVFDFNGDGAAEVLYNDECEFRIYDGSTGVVLYNEISRSRTAMENPVVADVDNDGNAEAITITNTENPDVRCEDDPAGGVLGPNGLQVFGDANDSWVASRRIWNQHAYHVTNVTEAAGIPLREAESWKEYNGRVYNTYRSQPRNYGVAPDLQVTAVSVSSPDVACGELGDQLIIAFEITNAGDIRVGPGVEVSFFGVWDGMESPLLGMDGAPLTYVIGSSLEPGRSLIDSVNFDIADQGADSLPDSVVVVVDTGGDADFGLERECIEDNNENGAEVVPGEPRPDLSLDVGTASVDCEALVASVEVTVTNSGTAEATGVVVEIYFGDPSAGGTPVTRATIDEPIPAGGSATVTVTIDEFPVNRPIRLWGVVDPDNAVTECNEADNIDPAENDIVCTTSTAGAR